VGVSGRLGLTALYLRFAPAEPPAASRRHGRDDRMTRSGPPWADRSGCLASRQRSPRWWRGGVASAPRWRGASLPC